jgi:hypothetical protein
MGNGKAPSIDLDTPEPIDDGTLARIGSPPPGPIGLDARSGSAKQGQASVADQIVSFPWLRRSKTRPVGRSESDPPEGSSFYAFLI